MIIKLQNSSMIFGFRQTIFRIKNIFSKSEKERKDSLVNLSIFLNHLMFTNYFRKLNIYNFSEFLYSQDKILKVQTKHQVLFLNENM